MTLELTHGIAGADRAEPAGDAPLLLRTVSDAAEWSRLLALAPHPHLPQSFAYAEGKAAGRWHPKRIVLSLDGRPVAIAGVLELRLLGLRVLNRINRGPIFLENDPSPDRVLAVLQAIRAHCGRLWQGCLLIAPALPAGEASNALLRQAGYRLRMSRGWTSGRIDLSADEDAIWRSFASTFRNRYRNAEKSGGTLDISTEDEAFEWLLAGHEANMREKGFSALSAAELRAMRAAAPDDVLVFRMLVEGRPVAGMSVARYGSHCEYHVGWFGPEGRQHNAGNFLMWGVIREMKRRGARVFDVGGLKPGDGYTQFKRTMRPAEYLLAGEWVSF